MSSSWLYSLKSSSLLKIRGGSNCIIHHIPLRPLYEKVGFISATTSEYDRKVLMLQKLWDSSPGITNFLEAESRHPRRKIAVRLYKDLNDWGALVLADHAIHNEKIVWRAKVDESRINTIPYEFNRIVWQKKMPAIIQKSVGLNFKQSRIPTIKALDSDLSDLISELLAICDFNALLWFYKKTKLLNGERSLFIEEAQKCLKNFSHSEFNSCSKLAQEDEHKFAQP